MKSFGFLVFVALTIICWGVYGPVLHGGQAGMGEGKTLSLLRPLVCVGLAYFLIAVVFPLVVLFAKGERGEWSVNGIFWSFAAGAIGAVGALGIALAFKFGGSAVYVMPLVFGFAPIINTLVTMLMSQTIREAAAIFYAGVIIVALGAAGVMWFKPKIEKFESNHAPGNVAVVSLVSNPIFQSEGEEENGSGSPRQESMPPRNPVSIDKEVDEAMDVFKVICCIALTAVCWGAYGPVLHKGQMKMSGSRLRPFLCVGIAYFVFAVIFPTTLLQTFPEPGGWWNMGLFWSLLAGGAGAIGALGIIYAFNFGGRPIFVMPLVFGGAPVVNTFSQTLTGRIGEVNPMFYLSLAMVIAGAIIVLTTAPKGHAPKPVQKTEPAS